MEDLSEALDGPLIHQTGLSAWCLCEVCRDERRARASAAEEQAAVLWDGYHGERLSAW
jgi:hypothetical protein